MDVAADNTAIERQASVWTVDRGHLPSLITHGAEFLHLGRHTVISHHRTDTHGCTSERTDLVDITA